MFHKFKTKTNNNTKIKIVTHHWSTNPKKGHKIYKQLDEYIRDNDQMSFTYIGRWPETEATLTNSAYYEPTGDNVAMSKIISDCNIYLTASEEEAGANHVLEAMACGLPIVYHNNGGSIPEYCGPYGVGFDNFDQMINAIQSINTNYTKYKNNVLGYEDQVPKAIAKYMEIINGLSR